MRKSGSSRYPYKWKIAREHYLAKHPSCINIGKPGCTGTATCIDHIQDHHFNQALFWNRHNWQPMCHHCHSTKTAKTQLRLPLEPRYDVNGEPTDINHPWKGEVNDVEGKAKDQRRSNAQQ